MIDNNCKHSNMDKAKILSFKVHLADLLPDHWIHLGLDLDDQPFRMLHPPQVQPLLLLQDQLQDLLHVAVADEQLLTHQLNQIAPKDIADLLGTVNQMHLVDHLQHLQSPKSIRFVNK